MKKFSKKLMALAMAGVMMCSPLMVSAAETSDKSVALTGGSSTGSGSLEGWVDSEVFIVDLPTEPVGGSPYNFKLDPQHLLNKTQGDTYTDANATVWFGTNAGTSEPLSAKSKSNIPVELSVTATVAGLKGTSSEIVMTDDDKFTDDTSTSLYMGVNLDGTTAAIAAGKTEAKNSVTLEAVAEDKFEFKYDAGSDPKYTYEFTGTDADAKQADFTLKAACNDAADWGAVAGDTIAPQVTVAWSMKPHVDYPETDGTTDVVIKYSGAKPAAGKITFTTPNGSTWAPPATHYTNGNITVTDSTITIKGSWLLTGVAPSQGFGTYTCTLNGTTYGFIVEVVPSTNGTSDIVISYTGTKPANNLSFKTPKGGSWTPPATHYTNGNITVTDSTITIKGSWLQGSVATSQGFGTYTFTLNGATYKFKVTE